MSQPEQTAICVVCGFKATPYEMCPGVLPRGSEPVWLCAACFLAYNCAGRWLADTDRQTRHED